jgi:hypothetical protein
MQAWIESAQGSSASSSTPIGLGESNGHPSSTRSSEKTEPPFMVAQPYGASQRLAIWSLSPGTWSLYTPME